MIAKLKLHMPSPVVIAITGLVVATMGCSAGGLLGEAAPPPDPTPIVVVLTPTPLPQSLLAEASAAQIEALKAQQEAAENAAMAQAGLASSLKDATEAQIAQTAIGLLGEALEDGTITLDQYAVAVQETPLAFGLVADLFGNLRMGTIIGMTLSFHMFGMAIGAYAGGVIFELTQSYFRFFLIQGLLELLAAGFAFSIKRPTIAN